MSLIEKEYALEKAENQYYLGVISERTKNEIIGFIKNLPPAEPELAQDLHNACIDAISRQAAIDANTRAVER